MVDTKDVEKSVLDTVQELSQKDISINELVSNIKSIIISAITKKGITAESCIDVAAKLIILASLALKK